MFLGVVKLLVACADGGVRGVAHKRTVRFRKRVKESKEKARKNQEREKERNRDNMQSR